MDFILFKTLIFLNLDWYKRKLYFTTEAKDLPQIVRLDSLEILQKFFDVYLSLLLNAVRRDHSNWSCCQSQCLHSWHSVQVNEMSLSMV